MAEIIELKGFVIKELYNIDKHFTDLSSSRIDLGKYHKEISTLREDCAPKVCIIKILVENLLKHTNSFHKDNLESNNSSYTDVNTRNDPRFLSPKKPIKTSNKNINHSIDVAKDKVLNVVSVF